jgi:hypothetical protein
MNDCSSLRLGKVENVVEIAKILGFGCIYNWYLHRLNHQYLYFRDSFFQGFGATSGFFSSRPRKRASERAVVGSGHHSWTPTPNALGI